MGDARDLIKGVRLVCNSLKRFHLQSPSIRAKT